MSLEMKGLHAPFGKAPVHRSGFTLVELLIVVIILGILAAVVVPQFNSSSQSAKDAALEADLRIMRVAIERYATQHGDEFPGTIGGATNWANFVTHMTTQTDENGDPGTRYGPYLRTGIPKNPYNGLNTGTVGLIPVGPSNVTGWYYDPNDGDFRANAPGKTLLGIDIIKM